MLFSNFGQLVVLVLVLVIGLCFGWVLHPGDKKWRRRYDEIVDASNAYRAEIAGHLREAESRATALERDNGTLQRRLDDAEARAARLDAGKIGSAAVSLAAAPEVAASTAPSPVAEEAPAPVETADVTPAAAETVEEAKADSIEEAEFTPVPDDTHAAVEPETAPVATETAEPAPAPEPEKRGWFGFGGPAREDDLGQLRGVDPDLKAKLGDLGVHRYADVTSLSAEDEMALEQRLGLPAGYIAREQWREQAALLAEGKVAEHGTRFAAAPAGE